MHCTSSARAADAAAMPALPPDATTRCGKAAPVVVVVAVVVAVVIVIVVGTGEAREPESAACAAMDFVSSSSGGCEEVDCECTKARIAWFTKWETPRPYYGEPH